MWISTAEAVTSALMPAPPWLVDQCLALELVVRAPDESCWLSARGADAWQAMWGPAGPTQ